MTSVPQVALAPGEIDSILAVRYRFDGLEAIEHALQDTQALPGSDSQILQRLRARIVATWGVHDHVVVRNLPSCSDGTTGLVLASLCFANLKRYRGGKIVKHFRMSPWTKALSHTLASGFFHTDLNTAEHPPAATAMQCLEADPGAPDYGQLRVARVCDLIERLRQRDSTVADFLLQERVTMVNEISPKGWEGSMVGEGLIRFHPESLLAAQRHFGKNPPTLEQHLAAIHQAAIEVSEPINLEPGEMLLVSNRRALHQRGACTVRFREFPSVFESRRVSVFHAYEEPA
ncbi:TauD/TfdA family dioxygenase [Paraburkholderia azotifigens]|uniref:TauD/TfdA family dioxygenase n=1 Tax=Paraburkholderia azotifigens TaxID=2057004 RepID=A0A5C6V262_9BURK|nr:TauD/TfdA family dioxygenase [Paraburkholderia azotifigens]TXC79104.1 TauD/TfdA family dioxygenase [Paraburkholderia azotifigens]